jgi:hypothetical protein
VPHHWCQCHDLRAAAQPSSEAERHAKKTLQKRVRGMRPLARPLAGRTAPQAEVMRGSGSAVRRALTDDGRPPWAAAGRKLHDRLTAIAASVERVDKRGACPQSSDACRPSSSAVEMTRRPCGLTCG